MSRSHGIVSQVPCGDVGRQRKRKLVRSLRRACNSYCTDLLISLEKACLVYMVFFSRYIWPGPPELFFASFCYGMAAHMVRWRLSARNRARVRLPLYLTPSELQLNIRHPPMISWVSIPALRERIIQHCHSDRQFDLVWMDLMAYAVVQIEEISSLLTGVGQGPGFLGVWNIFDAISNIKHPDSQVQDAYHSSKPFPELSDLETLGLLQVYRMQLPDTPQTSTGVAQPKGVWEPTSLESLLSSSQLARKLYYHLELYEAHKTWRLDPAFFEKYPDLRWDGCQNFTATGVCLRMAPRSLAIQATSHAREEIFYHYQEALFNIDSLTPL